MAEAWRAEPGQPPVKPRPWKALADLIGLVARSGAPQLRLRLLAAVLLTLGGKAVGVLAPLLLGKAVNSLARHAGASSVAQIGWSFAGLAFGWALVRFIASAAPQIRDILFGVVTQAAWRRASAETFAHALSLSIDFHQTKRTGALSRTVERGARAVDYLIRVLIFNLAPTALELVFAAAVLARAYDWRFAAVAVATVAVYAAMTFAMSNWRIHHRRELNEADSEASGRAVDALLNYETVKAFGAEERAVGDYDEALGRYARASVKANTSLALLNIAQAAIQSAGLGVMALLAGIEAAAGRMGPGDVTASILIMTSLYMPLNFLGFAYREVRQSFIDMEAMTALRDQRPEVADLAGRARPGVERPARRRGGVRGRLVPSLRPGRGPARGVVPRPPRRHRGAGRPVGRRQDHPGAAGPAPDRSAGGPGADRRPGPARRGPGVGAPRRGAGAPGRGPCSTTAWASTSASAGRARARRRSGRPPRPRSWAPSCGRCPTACRRGWGSGGSSCRAASARGWGWRGRCWRTRGC